MLFNMLAISHWWYFIEKYNSNFFLFLRYEKIHRYRGYSNYVLVSCFLVSVRSLENVYLCRFAKLKSLVSIGSLSYYKEDRCRITSFKVIGSLRDLILHNSSMSFYRFCLLFTVSSNIVTTDI